MDTFIIISIITIVVVAIILFYSAYKKNTEPHIDSITESKENPPVQSPKYKVCPMCGSLWYHPNRDYIQNRCHYCDVELQELGSEYDGWDYYKLEGEYVRQHIFPDPVKREAYKNMKEILELELERAREDGCRFDAEQRIARGDTPKCPTCGSTNVEKLTSLDRGVSVSVLGPFSNKINKSFKCRNCKYTW